MFDKDRPLFYKLVGTKVQPCELYEINTDNQLWKTLVNGYIVSTVFLHIDHSLHIVEEPPTLFETMVIGPDKEFLDIQKRYTDYHDAEKGHSYVCYQIKLGNLEI